MSADQSSPDDAPHGPWGAVRVRWRLLRANNDLSWPNTPVLNWMVGLCLAIIVAVALFLAWFDWDMLRGPISRYASAATGRNVRIEGHLRVHPFSWTPSADVGGLRIGNPAWAGRGDTAQLGQSRVVVKLIPLLSGRLEVTRLELDRPVLYLLKDAQGRETWNFSPDPRHAPAKGPTIHTLIVRDGLLRFIDVKGHSRFSGRFSSLDRDTPDARSGVHFSGLGDLHERPFELIASGGPIVHLQKNRPYPVIADVRNGSSRVAFKGELRRPFDLNHVTGRLSVTGADLANLYFLTGLVLPNTPKYSLSGEAVRDGQLYAIDGLKGRVGDSDLGGSISVDSTSGRPFLKADLRSRSLVFDDLAALFGGGVQKATASPAQQAVAAAMKADRRLLPDSTLNVERVRAMDADVRFRADAVKARFVPLRSIQLRLKLDHGLLTLDPFTAGFPRGTITGRASIDARGATPVTSLDLRATNIRIEDFMAKAGTEQAVSGPILARLKLTGQGASVHAAAAAANGAMTIVVPHGEVRKAFAELAGINAIKGVILLWSHNQDRTDLRCAVAHFDVRQGVMRSRRLVFDTGPVLIDGGGAINLGTEGLDFTLTGHSKQFRIGHLNAPVQVGGKLAAPRFSVSTGRIVTQGGIALAAGVFLSPLAAILPFVDPGLAKDADCSGLVSEQASAKAPVKGAARAK